MLLVTQNTAQPRQPGLHSRDESIYLKFTAVLSRHCVQVSWRAVTGECASTIFSCLDPSRTSPRIAATRSGTPRSSSCSRHGAHPSVPSCLLFVHCSASGSAWHITSRRAMATRPAGCAVGVLSLATRRFSWLSSTRGRPEARSRVDLKIGAKWRAAVALQPRRAGRRSAAHA